MVRFDVAGKITTSITKSRAGYYTVTLLEIMAEGWKRVRFHRNGIQSLDRARDVAREARASVGEARA